jgi:hypothetical protein
MSTSEVIGSGPGVKQVFRRVELLDEPYTMIPESDPAASLRVLAHSVSLGSGADILIAGYVATKPGRSTILDEFSSEPTGEVMPCNAVKGFVGEVRVYIKMLVPICLYQA